MTSPIATSTAPIETCSLSMRYGARESALTGFSLTIPDGAIYALIGPNGAGKSTLIKLLLNILRPTSGTASVLGRPSTSISAEAFTEIAYVSENQELPEWMTASQFLAYLRPFYPLWDMALEQQLARQLNIPMSRKLKHLSRGQRMKASLLSVLPYNPKLIILDEPFSGLDPLVRDELTEGLLDRAAQPNPPTILISSHDLAEVETIATHVGFLDHGQLLFSEESAALARRFQQVTVTLAPNASSPSTPCVSSSAASYPTTWLLPELGPSIFRFVHSHADNETIHSQISTTFPNAKAIDTEPMSLRSIFVALAKSARPTTQDTVAVSRRQA